MSGSSSADCRRNSWLVALAGGVLVALMLTLVARYPVMKALVIGVVLCVLLGIFLVWAFCSQDAGSEAPHARPVAPPEPKPAPTPDRPAERAGAPTPPAFVSAQPSAQPVPAHQASAAETAAEPVAKKSAPRQRRSPAGLDAALAKSKDEPAPPAPEMLPAPRGGKADDLKQIRGIGPKLEALLNEVGVWHFDQIASWKARDIAHVDEKLVGFRGRITRDKWVKQAKVLAAGGATDFSERVKKGGVYREDE